MSTRPSPHGLPGWQAFADSLDQAKVAFRAALGVAAAIVRSREKRTRNARAGLCADDPGCVKTLYFIMIGVIPAI
jgi:hypothetical protein